MSDLKRALSRANLGQAALLAVPWIVLQLGGFWALSDPRAGAAGAAGVGAIAMFAFLALAVWYRWSHVQLANIVQNLTDADAEYYGFFSFFRLWGDQLEFIRRRNPGYLNALRLNYIALPLAFLACVMNFWTAALLMVLIWLLTGMLVRSAVVRVVSPQDSLVPWAIRCKVILLLVLAIAAWGVVRYEASRAERMCDAKLAQLETASEPVSAADLAKRYRLNGQNGAELVAAWKMIPAIPDALARLAAPVWIENVPPDAYVEMEKFVFNQDAPMRKLTELERIPTARLGCDLAKGFEGVGDTQELIMRYRQLEWLELLRLLSAASIGNDRQVGESWTGWGNLRRQLSAEPALIYSMVVMGMESRRLDALERVVNEFGIHSDREMRLLDADLAASEKELAANLEQGLRGEVALSLISGLDPMVEWSRASGRFSGLSRLFPAFQWARFRCKFWYLEGMERFRNAVSEPQRLEAAAAWLRALPFGAEPVVSVLSEVNGEMDRYVALLRKARSARVALALDRSRKARGGFPETLGDVSGLSAELLADPAGGPLAYSADGFEVKAVDPAAGSSRMQKFDGAEIGGRNGFRLRK